MINLADFKEKMQHKGGECCDFEAYKVDSADDTHSMIKGLSSSLGFKNGQVSQVDYFLPHENKIYLIELSDLKDDIKSSQRMSLISDNPMESFAEVLVKSPKTAKKIITGKIWADVVAEFQKKWLGSIAIIERYYRKQGDTKDLNYQFIIIIKNSQDIDELNILKNRLEGMTGEVFVLKTQQVKSFLEQLLNS